MYKTLSKIILLLFITVFISCGKDESVDNLIYTTDDQFFNDGDIEIVFENNKSNGINVIFLGDIYFQNDLEAENGKYRTHALSNINYLFNTPPFSEYKEYFNAYIIYAESKSSKSDDGGLVVETPFGAYVDYDGNLLLENWNPITEYLEKQNFDPQNGKNLVLLSVNGKNAKVNGFAVLNGNLAVFGDGNNEIMIHEVGHAFASLGDEYIREDYPAYALANNTANLDSTNNLTSIKWKHFIGLDGYEHVGAYEGGNYRSTGFWRPEQTSIMGVSYLANSFNTPSREAIVKKIFELHNMEYSFEDFLKIDENANKSSKQLKAKTEIQSLQKIKCATIQF